MNTVKFKIVRSTRRNFITHKPVDSYYLYIDDKLIQECYSNLRAVKEFMEIYKDSLIKPMEEVVYQETFTYN
jgi:hypothetical protein